MASALFRITLGAALVVTAAAIEAPPVRGGLAIAGALLVFHLGAFDLLASAWRKAGVPVDRICPEPWRAASLAEFWGNRWNRAFHDFARNRLYRPLA